MRALVAVIVASALAGCAGPGTWSSGHCGPTSTALSWHQPGLYDAFPSAAAGAAWVPGDGALPWSNPWDELPGLRLESLSLQVMRPTYLTRGVVAYAEPHLVRVELARDGAVRAYTDGVVDASVVLTAFHRVAANVSLASHDQLEEAARRFVASGHETGSSTEIPLDDEGRKFAKQMHWQYDAPMPGPLRLDDLVAGLVPSGPQGGRVGQMWAEAGNWTVGFTLPTWTLPGRQGDALTVDSRGAAHYDGGDGGDGTVAGLERAAQDLAGKAGLPPLQLDGADAATYIC